MTRIRMNYIYFLSLALRGHLTLTRTHLDCSARKKDLSAFRLWGKASGAVRSFLFRLQSQDLDSHDEG